MQAVQILCCVSILAGLCPAADAQGGQDKSPDKPTTTTVQVKTTKLARVGSDIVGTQLVSPKNEPLGKAENLVIHPRGDVAFVEFSPASSIKQDGQVRYVVPWRALDRNENGHFVLATTPEEFVKLPRYEKPKMDNMDWWTDADRAYAKIVSAKATPVEASATLAPSKSLYMASDLRSRIIENPDGQKVATVHELVVDPTVGRVAYVVLSVGGSAGANERMIATPWEALKSMPDKQNPKVERLTLATTSDKLAAAPEFQATTEGWAKASEPDYVIRVYEYYSTPLYRPMGSSTEPKK